MAAFHRAGMERVNVFPVDERYLFKHYFEGDDVFDRLKPYYNHQHYRFEVPPSDFEDLQDFLESHGYALVVVDAAEEFVVVVRKYSHHPENIFKDSVVHRSAGDFNCFLMTDRESVDRAVDDGATRLGASNIDNPL